MFKDALQWCGSEGCVVYSAQLIARGPDSVADETAVSWLNGISLITKPTNNMLTAMMVGWMQSFSSLMNLGSIICLCVIKLLISNISLLSVFQRNFLGLIFGASFIHIAQSIIFKRSILV